MKGDFIPKFINIFIETGKDIYDIWQWQPLYYKGVHISGPQYRKSYNGFKNLENRGFIKNHPGGYKFTEKGRRWFQYSTVKYFELKNQHKKWDKKWRVVIFDIPNSMNKERNWLRSRLKILGFHSIQKSVFALPYKCEEELGELCSNIGVSNYVDIMIVESIGSKELELKKYFKL